MKYSLAITCLLAPSSEALKLSNLAKNLVEKFPTFPSGDNLTKLVAKGLEAGRGALQDEMSQTETYCNSQWNNETQSYSDEQECEEYESGLKKDIDRANRDAVEAFEEIAGVELTENNLISGKFVTDLIMAEYDDFVTGFNAHREQIAGDIDQGLAALSAGASQMGLAQVKSKAGRMASCWEARDAIEQAGRTAGGCGRDYGDEVSAGLYAQVTQEGACPGYCCNNWDDAQQGFWNEQYALMDAAFMECAETESDWARDLSQAMGPAENINAMITQGLQMVNQLSQDANSVSQLERAIEDLNGELSREADRVGLSGYTLPDPADTAAKVAAFALAVTTKELGGEGAFGRTPLAEKGAELKQDMVQAAYRAERDVQGALDDLGTLDSAEDVQRALEEARGMVNSEEAAGMAAMVSGALKEEADVDWSAAEILAFANDSIDTAEAIAANPGPVVGMAMDAERQIERELM